MQFEKSTPMESDHDTVQGLLLAGARDWPERDLVLFEDGTSWTRSQALSEGLTAASALKKAGVRSGDRVALILPNGADWLRAWWGLSLLGAVVVPFNPSFIGRILQELLDTTEPTHLIAAAIPAGVQTPARLVTPKELLACDAPLREIAPAKAEDPHLIIFTSGTTGKSKGSLTSNWHVVNQSQWLVDGAGITADDRYMGDLPLFHMAALGSFALMMRVGGSVALRGRPSFSRYWEVVKEAQTTYGSLVSSMASRLIQNPPTKAEQDHRMRFFLSAPLPAEAEKFIERFGLEGLCTAFGSTETSTVICKPLDAPCQPGSCGSARPGFELRIVDGAGRDLPDGERGELLVRPMYRPAMSLGYFGNDQANNEVWHDGWYHTGDIFERDASGLYFWRDRLKESIRRRGENVSSFEVEREILAFPGIVEAACISVPGAFQGDEEIKAFLVVNDRIHYHALVSFLNSRLPYFMIPRFFETVDELPKTATMKVQKFKLQEREPGGHQWDREADGIRLNRPQTSG